MDKYINAQGLVFATFVIVGVLGILYGNLLFLFIALIPAIFTFAKRNLRDGWKWKDMGGSLGNWFFGVFMIFMFFGLTFILVLFASGMFYMALKDVLS